MPPAEARVAPEELNSDQSSVQSSSESSDVSTKLETAEQNPPPDVPQHVVGWRQAFSDNTHNQLEEDAQRIATELPRAPGEEVTSEDFDDRVDRIIRTIRDCAPRMLAEIGMRPDGSVGLSTVLKETSNQAQTIWRDGNAPNFGREFVATIDLIFEQPPLEEDQGWTRTKTCSVKIIFSSCISGFTDIDQQWRTEILAHLRELTRRGLHTQDVYNATMLTFMRSTSHYRETKLRESLHIPKNSSLLHFRAETRIDKYSEGEATHPSDHPSPTYSVTISYNCSHSNDGHVWTKVACPWETELTVHERMIEYTIDSSRPTSPNSLSAIGTSSASTQA